MSIRLLAVLLCLVVFAGCQHFQPRNPGVDTTDVRSWETPPPPPSSGPSEAEMKEISDRNRELTDRVTELRRRVDAMKEGDAATEPAPGASAPVMESGGCPACVDPERVAQALRDAGLNDLAVSTTSAGETCVILSGKISFGAGRADLMKTAKERLAALSPVLRDLCPDLRLRFDGHTDSDPIRKSKWSGNQELSEARAAAVAKHFTGALGWAAAKVTTRGFGADRPIAANSTREGKATNRRVEIVLLH